MPIDHKSIISCSLIPEEIARAIGERMAEIIAEQSKLPSFMSVVVEHQKNNPHKSPMQCMKDARPEYERICALARSKSQDCK